MENSKHYLTLAENIDIRNNMMIKRFAKWALPECHELVETGIYVMIVMSVVIAISKFLVWLN
jgi:hypothetical protein